MAFWRCFYHLVWATKGRLPRISSQHEDIIFNSLRAKSVHLECELLCVNGIADHIHLAISMPPTLAISHVVKDLKGRSSFNVNQDIQEDIPFKWQETFAVFTVSEKALPNVLDYINNQKTHHANGTVYDYFEKIPPEAR